MARLNGQDGSGGGEILLGHNVGGSAEIGTDTYALEDGGRGDEGLDVGDAEGIGAFLDRGGTGRRQGGGQEGHVRALVQGGLLDVVVEGLVEASCLEIGEREVLEAFTVKLVLELLKGQSVVEDVGWHSY